MNRFIKTFSLLALVALFMGSCTAQKGANTTSLAAWKNAVKGQWTLQSVTEENFPKGASVKNIFDDAPIACFINSQWNLTGSGKGSISFTEAGSYCAPGAIRDIFWSLTRSEMGDLVNFQFKKILPGDKAKDVTVGYQLNLESAGEGRMTMAMPLDVGNNEAGFLVFHFTR